MKTDKPKRDIPREILFAPAADEEILSFNLSDHDYAIFERRLMDVSELVDVDDDPYVQVIAQTRKWARQWKKQPWRRLRLNNLDPSIRIAFSLERGGSVLFIRCASRRTEETYNAFEQLYIAVMKPKPAAAA